MKRLALLTVFFYVCSFASPQRAQAVVPLALIAAAAVGTAMMSASVGTYYAQNGVLPEYVSATAGAVASAADKIFQPSYLAKGAYSLLTPESLTTAKDYYVGKAAATSAKIGDIVDFVKTSSEGMYTNFKSLISDNTLDGVPDYNAITIGTIFKTSSGNFKISFNYGTYESYLSTWLSARSSDFCIIKNYIYIDIPNKRLFVNYGVYAPQPNLNNLGSFALVSTAEPDNYNVPAGSIDYPGLKDSLDPTFPAAVADEIPNILKSMPPSQVTAASANPASVAEESAPPAITQADINAALKANTAAVAQAVAQAAADIAAANPTDAAAQIAAAQAAADAAKAAEEAAIEEPAQETFSPISDTAFTAPYNPGAFDIPARFTTFLNNVKSSGLFSFSNDFFNSLPGGGSPIFEIEAGRYGHHTIDLSTTMSTGLAVLKSILLACFGSLSIRAVIMKR